MHVKVRVKAMSGMHDIHNFIFEKDCYNCGFSGK